MHIVQSFWSCNKRDLLHFNAGWASPEYNLMGWALSCLQLRSYYNDVTLFADSASAKLLIDDLQLPYTEANCSLDKLNKYNPELWALPKIYTYSQQEQPFLHVDGDVFIWKKFDNELMSGDIMAQNKEAATNYYGKIMRSLEASLTYFPAELLEERKRAGNIYAYNAGIMGGSDIGFFSDCTSRAITFIERNIGDLKKINVSNFNIFFEQHLFYCLVKAQNKPVSVLFDEVFEDNGYGRFCDFAGVPYNTTYIHLLGTLKRNIAICDRMAAQLRHEHPLYYYRIVKLFRDKNLSLKKDYYSTIPAELDLHQRYHVLKEAEVVIRRQKPVGHFSFERLDNYQHCINSLKDSEFASAELKTLKEDLFNLKNKIRSAFSNQLSDISPDFLYQRDIISHSYTGDVFADESKTMEVQLTNYNFIPMVACRYDWTILNNNENTISFNIRELVSSYDDDGKIALVPECDTERYSMVYIDELDSCILQKLSNALSIRNLLTEMATEFDEQEINENPSEFQRLIFGRLKKALVNKLIKRFTTIKDLH